MDLTGVRVLVTRAAHQAGGLVDVLRDGGAEVLAMPTIEIAPRIPGTPSTMF